VAVAQYTFTYKQYTEQHNVPAELKNPSLPTWFMISVNTRNNVQVEENNSSGVCSPVIR
jgi:hypothetical protein